MASGDPLPDGVVLWTRLAPDPQAPDGRGGMPAEPVPLLWEVATDERFDHIVGAGLVSAAPEHAHTVHVEVTGLSPDRWYAYRFRVGRLGQPGGRTRTAPAAGGTAGPAAPGGRFVPALGGRLLHRLPPPGGRTTPTSSCGRGDYIYAEA